MSEQNRSQAVPQQPQFPRVVHETEDEQCVELSVSYNKYGVRGNIQRLEASFDKTDAEVTLYRMHSYQESKALVLDCEELEALFTGYLRFLTAQEMFITDGPIHNDPLVQAFTAYVQANEAYQAEMDEAARRFDGGTISYHF